MKQYNDVFETYNEGLYSFLLSYGYEPILTAKDRYIYEISEDLLIFVDCYFSMLGQ